MTNQILWSYFCVPATVPREPAAHVTLNVTVGGEAEKFAPSDSVNVRCDWANASPSPPNPQRGRRSKREKRSFFIIVLVLFVNFYLLIFILCLTVFFWDGIPNGMPVSAGNSSSTERCSPNGLQNHTIMNFRYNIKYLFF
jgi:hypothetical protein